MENKCDFISKISEPQQLRMLKYYMELINKPVDDYNFAGAKHDFLGDYSRFEISSKNNGPCHAMLSDYFVAMLFNGVCDEKDLSIINLCHTVKMSEIFEDPYIEGLLKHVEEQKNNPIFDNPTNSSQLNNIPTDNPNM